MTATTQRFRFATKLIAGQEQRYEEVHCAISPELHEAMRAAGVVSWRIFRNNTTLTHQVEAVDRGRMEAILADDPVNRDWQKQVAPFLDKADVSVPAIQGALIWDFTWPTK
jgi:L-rhamnose mutarotase